jgi:hypothetical protein
MFVHLTIAEAISDEQVREFVKIVQKLRTTIESQPEFVSMHIDVEPQGGKLILITTVWQTVTGMASYRSHQIQRQIQRATQHLTLCSLVTKTIEHQTWGGRAMICDPEGFVGAGF